MNRGIALLFTLLIISVAISLSVGVFNIILGELQIGEGAGESMRAFFAADSGVECILYWDLKEQAFVFDKEKEITCFGSSPSFSRPCQTAFCQQIDGKAATVYTSPPCPGEKALTLSNNSCVTLTVIKFNDGASRIESLGENIKNPSAARVVQRGVEVNY